MSLSVHTVEKGVICAADVAAVAAELGAAELGAACFELGPASA